MSSNCEIKEKPKGFNQLIRSWYFWKPALSIIIGGILGYAYYHFQGCTNGCAITGSPITSTIYGALMGWFLVAKPFCKC